jgi:large subunit ribosomal protein LP0
MEPGKTSFFQALGVPTKIARGTIEIVNDVEIIKAGSKVGASEAALLNMLNISPFTYGMTISSIYDAGTVFDSSILDITEDVLIKGLLAGIADVACISLAINYPTTASVPHSLANGYKNVLAVGLTLENYGFAAVDKVIRLGA